MPPLVIAATRFAAFLGVFFGLYALLTGGQRRTMREIRAAASGRGWRYRIRHWQGNPTAFRIDGQTRSGLNWILTSGDTSSYDRGWSVRLGLRIPALGGEVDFAILPRDSDGRDFALAGSAVPPGVENRLAALSGAAASAIGFFRDAREFQSGLSAFDAAYHILALPRHISHPPVDPALAGRFLSWPADAIAPHSVLAWRDPFGFHIHARLPGTPNQATVTYFVALAEDFCARIPAPAMSPAPSGFVDRLVARFLRS